MDTNNQSQPTQPTPNPPGVPPTVFPSAVAPGTVEDLENKALQARISPAQQQQNPSASQQQTQRPSQVQPSLHARVFDAILKGMTGGDRKVVNSDGTVSTVPSSRGSMGKAIVAAALTGLMTPDHFRDTPYGPVRDYSADMAGAAQASKQTMEQWRNAPQKLSDEQQAARLSTLSNNAKLLQLQLASAHLGHQMREESQADLDRFMQPFKEYQENRSPDQPEAFLAQGLNHIEAMNKLKEAGITQANAVQDGWRQSYNPQTQQTEWEPSYAILNPDLKNITSTKPVADKLAQINSQYQDIHKLTGNDNLQLPVGLYVSAMHDYNAVQQTEHALDRVNAVLHPDAKAGELTPFDISSVLRNNRDLTHKLWGIQQVMAGGNTPDADGSPENVLGSVIHFAPELLTPEVLQKLGFRDIKAAQDQVDKWHNDRVAAATAARNTGTSKQIADDATVNGLIAAANLLPDDQQKTVLPTLKAGTTTKADAQKAQTQIATFQRANQSNATKQALQNGDPSVAAQTAKNILDGAYANVKDLASMRGNAREVLQNAVVAEAQARGLDISKWGEAALTTKTNMYREYRDANKNKVGANIVAFRTFLDHADDALQANETWRRANSPLLNKPLSWLATNATNDPAYTQFVTALEPVKKEFMSFLNANRAEHEADIKTMDTVLSETSTPAQIETALKTLSKSADKRLAELASSYNSTMGVTMPEMLTPKAKDILNRMGTNSEAIPLTVALPKGNGQKLQDPTPFMQAAGGDKTLAREIAKQAGWTF